MEETIQFTLNGKPIKLTVDSNRKLLWILRTDLELTGTKYGCGEGYCGTCTVLINNEAVRSCQTIIKEVNGKEVVTIEGLVQNGDLHPVQKAFVEHDALQCGFCTPGMILNAVSLLEENPQPSYSEIIDGMENNLCRCGSHKRIVEAIQDVANSINGGE
jgi:aerobic-type carbon monoxide dehydrogenase small subunit (CoxS/CutS family)